MAFFEDTEGNTLAITTEKPVARHDGPFDRRK